MIKRFEEFISSLFGNQIDENKDQTQEPEKKSGCNLVFVTKNPHSDTSKGEYGRFRDSAKKYDVNIYPIDVDVIKYKLTPDGDLEIDGVGVFSKRDTLFMFRHAVRIANTPDEKKVTQTNVKNFKSLLKSNGFMLSNDASVAGICKSKTKTFDILKKNNVSTIDTFTITRSDYESQNMDSIDGLQKYLDKNSLNFPIVLKLVDGTQGIGVIKCQDISTLSSVSQYIVRKEGRFLLQPFCEIDYDIRVHVFCKTLKPESASVDDFVVVGSMRRDKVAGDFRTNYSLGGHISEYHLSKEEKRLAKEAAKAIGSVWCGVDICHDNLSGKNYVLEVNSSPALKGITKVASEAPTDLMVKHIKKALSGKVDDKEKMSNRELVSYNETIYLDGIPVIGNFDTGNSVLPAYKSHHFEEKDGHIEFKVGGQLVKKKIVRRKSVLHGGQKSEERPVVKFDLSFNGKTLKDVEVCVRGLTKDEIKREERTGKKVKERVLLSTDVIDKLNLIVHPDRDEKFMKTKKPKKAK